jgi:hypothetical protein
LLSATAFVPSSNVSEARAAAQASTAALQRNKQAPLCWCLFSKTINGHKKAPAQQTLKDDRNL